MVLRNKKSLKKKTEAVNVISRQEKPLLAGHKAVTIKEEIDRFDHIKIFKFYILKTNSHSAVLCQLFWEG